LCEKLEKADFDAAGALAKELHIPMQDILNSQGDAMIWVCQLSQSTTDA
jgi:hypothetical protein